MKAITGLFLLGAAVAWGQENYSEWTHSKPVTVNTAGLGLSGNTTQFPLLVRLDASAADVFASAGPRGASLRFVKANGTVRLQHQVDYWDAASQTAAVWVLMDTVLQNGAQTIRMYWEKSGAADSSNGAAVFSTANGYVGVWHMGDSSGNRLNSVAGGPHAMPVNYTGTFRPGIIGAADSLIPATAAGNTAHTYLKILSSGYQGFANFNNGLTYSGWVRPAPDGFWGRFFQLATNFQNANGNNRLILARFESSSSLAGRIGVGNTNNTFNSDAGAIINSEWQRVSFVKIGNSVRLYRNDTLLNEFPYTGGIPNQLRDSAYFGRSFDAANTAGGGLFDDQVISNVGRSESWIRLEYATQRPGQKVVSVGDIVAQPQSVTVTGGANAQFTVQALEAGGTLSYQWRKNGTNLANGGPVAGAMSDTLKLTGVVLADTGAYSVVVTRTVGGTPTSATSAAANLSVNVAPAITGQPQAQPMTVGAPFTFTVTVAPGAGSMSGTLSYQWRKDGVNIPVGTVATYTKANAVLADTGAYSVVVTRTLNGTTTSTTSANAPLNSPTGLAPGGAFVLRVTGADRPYTFRLPAGVTGVERVTMNLSDVWGRTLWTKSIEPSKDAKAREVTWNGRTSNGRLASAGTYVVRIAVTANGQTTHYVQESVMLESGQP